MSSRIRNWLFDEALPFWGDAGLDRAHGGFLEEVGAAGEPTACAFKRLRVSCRQIYVFSHAALLGWAPGRALSDHGYEYLIEKAWLGEERGWATRLTREGGVLDATPNLYDLAFVLFALAWRFRLTRDEETRLRIEQTLRFIKLEMSAGGLGGYWHQKPAQGPRLQNPHMHLHEAALALTDAAADAEGLFLAREIAGLFKHRFIQGASVCEYFTADLRPLPGRDGGVREPGHNFEWAWILAQHSRLTGEDFSETVAALVGFAERGVDAAGAVFDETDAAGAPVRMTSRTWPNTERIKGWLGLFELTGRDPRAAVIQSARLLLDRYLAAPRRGAWVDQFDATGAPTTLIAPASTFYHVFLAFSEVLRLEPALAALE
ncbi:MAG: AGE family epimerase/isomerase [Hyphomonadaceae bacterium]